MNEKKTAAAFDLLTPTEEQKNYIYERILSRAGTTKAAGNFVIKRGGAYALAAAVFMICCTFAASALGIVDLQKAFGGIFKGDVAEMESISTVPENVTTTGDDRITLKVIAIGGTKNEVAGAIEMVRNDGGTFSENLVLYHDTKINPDIPNFSMGYDIDVKDSRTAILSFRCFGSDLKYDSADFSDENSIIGRNLTLTFTKIYDYERYRKASESLWLYNANENEYNAAMEKYGAVLLDGEWSISFPLEYNADYRTADVNASVKILNDKWKKTDAAVSMIGYSSISADIYIEDFDGRYNSNPFCSNANQAFVKLSDGTVKEIKYPEVVSENNGQCRLHCQFDTPINIDNIKSIIMNDTEIPIP